jgi:hypothetical protein
MIILRDFIFLNTNMLNNYLSTIDGYFADELVYTESEKGQKSGKLGYAPIVEGNASSETSWETKSKRVLTPSSQFQKLYEVLEKQEQIRHLDLFDDGYWANIQKGEILEIQARVRLPAFIMQLEQVQGITPFINLIQKYGVGTVTDFDLTALEGMSDLQKISESKPIPLLIQSASTPKFNFVADLSREYIIGNLTDFQGEAVVFGKVQRILNKGQKLDAFNFLSDMLAMPNLNRQQRLALKSNKNNKAKDTFTETLLGPAIVLTPLAVYR